MAIKSKSDIQNDIDTDLADNGSGNITPSILRGVLTDMLDSYEDIFQSYTTAGRDALTGMATGLVIYNTTTNALEVYNGSTWVQITNRQAYPIDCSTNPNYPAAIVGDFFIVNVAGKIGGGSGKAVRKGDIIWCITKNAGGNEATVGTSFMISYNVGNSTNAFDDVYKTSVTLSASDIANAHITPINSVPSGGAGTLIMPIKVVTNYDYGTVAFNAVDLQLKFAGAIVSAATLISLNVTADKLTVVAPSSTVTDVWMAAANLQIVTSGDAGSTGDGTVKVDVYYKIHTL